MTKPPTGITPPTRGLDREEPEFAIEDDIPSDDDAGGEPGPREGQRKAERE